MELTQSQITSILAQYRSVHSQMSKRQRYYDGLHDICQTFEANADGVAKNRVPDNFIRYIVESYTGALTSIPFNYVLASDEEDKTPLENLDIIIDRNDLHTIDTEHLRTALTFGYSVEVHSFINREIIITQHDPREFSFVFDQNGNIVYAIRQIILSPFTYYNDVLLDKETKLIMVYSDTEVITYREVIAENKSHLVEDERIQHAYGRVPVVLFTVNNSKSSFLSDALLTQNDIYNKVASAVIDDIEYNADALLVISGYKEDEIVACKDIINKHRVLPLSEDGGKAEFIQKGNQVEKLQNALNNAREAIHRMADVPDMKDIVGNTGQASGTAIRQRYSKMMQTGNTFAKYIKQGVKKRIELIEIIWSKLSKPTFGYYDVVIEFNLPLNNIDTWQGITYLKDIVSRKSLLKLIPEIEDPEAELETIALEQTKGIGETPSTIPQNGPNLPSKPSNLAPTPKDPPKEQVAKKQALADKAISKATPNVASLLKESVKPIPKQELEAFVKANRS